MEIIGVKKRIVLFVIIIFLTFSSVPGTACNVPVFRYALERWQVDTYQVFVFQRGALPPEDKSIVDWLKLSSNTHIPYSNYKIHTLDLETQLEAPIRNFWESLDSPKLPYMVVFYPNTFWIKIPIWHGHLTEHEAKAFVKSPVRQEIAERILNGDSGIFILLESGDKKKDDAAAEILQTQLKKLENSLTLPEIFDSGTYKDIVILNEEGPELHVAFSMIRLSRKEPAESHFISMLMNSEPDLSEYTSYPMVFPVYGRGRILYALIGDGINERNIRRACEFIIGPCSCIIKAQNPGVDILVITDWNSGLEGHWVKDVELPPLVGLSELASIATANESPMVSDDKTEIDDVKNNLLRNILLALGLIVIVIILLSLRVKWLGNKGEIK